jgi:GNAT superfamily N-acetyltransferase
MDLNKLAQELGGQPVTDLDSLASELGGQVASTPGGYGAGTVATDVGKLVSSGAVKGIAGAPETVQAVASETGRSTLFGPTEALNLIADPRRLANKLVGSVGLPPVFEVTKEQPLVPAEVTEKQKAAVNETLAKGKVPQLRQLTEYGNKLSQDIENTVSPEMRLAMAESQPTGNIIKALETGDFSELSMGKNPTALGLTGQAVKVFGSSAPALLVAMVTKSAGPATAVGFGQAGAEGIDEARNYVKGMSDEELAKQSEYFRNLITLGYSPKDARLMTEDKAADTAALYQGSVGALGSAFTTKLIQGGFDKALLGNVKSRLGKIVQGTAIAGTEGALTEAAEGVATDLGINKTIVREIGVDSFANLVLGAIGEAAPGVIRGAVAPGEAVKGAEAPESKATPEAASAVAPAAMPAIITDEAIEAEEGLTPVSPTPEAVVPLTPTPTPTPPAAATAEIAQRIEELDAELKAIDSAYNSATPEQFTELNARQGEIKSEIARLFRAGTTGAPITAVTPTPTEAAATSQENIINLEQKIREKFISGAAKEALDGQLMVLSDLYNTGIATDADLDAFQSAVLKAPDQLTAIARGTKVLNPIKAKQKTALEQRVVTPPANEPEAAEAPPVEASKFVEDETGEKLSYPMFVDMADKGYKLYSFENPRTYENKGGVRYRTLEKDGVRLALEPQQVLFTDPKKPNQQPQLGMGNENDVAFHFIGVDPDVRKQGKARQAIQDLVEIADKNNFTLYGEPAQLEKDGMTKDQLLNFYKQFGFNPTNDTNKVIVREPGAKAISAEEPKELVGAEKKLDYIIKNKDSIVKQMADNYKISQEYAAKAYDAELEYTRAASRAYGDHPNKISEKDFKAAIKKHSTFFNKLKGVSSRVKEKPAPTETKTQAEINRERQAKKKIPDNFTEYEIIDALENIRNGRYFGEPQKVKNLYSEELYDEAIAKGLIEERAYNKFVFTEEGNKGSERWLATEEPPKKEEKPEVKPKTKSEINRDRQAEKKAAAEAAKKAADKKKADEAEMDAQLEAAERGEEAAKVEKKPEIKIEKQPDLTAPKLNQEWAKFKTELTEKPSSLTSEVYDQYKRFKDGNFSVPTATFTGAEARKRTNEFNKNAKSLYDKAAREFLNRSISIKPPTKNQQKLQVPDNLLAVPPPITKAIKGKAETIDQQKKALLSIAAPKSDPRAAIKGVLVEPDKMVSTDGHRMAILLGNTNVPETVILDKDNKPIDSSYPAYDRVADQAKNAKLVAAVNSIALGDYARGINKAQKYIDNGRPPFMFRIDGQNHVYDGEYVEDLANLFRQFGYNEFNVGLASEKNNMLVAKSPDGKLTQYLMGVRDDRSIYMPFEVATGQPGFTLDKKEDRPSDKPYYNDFTSNIDSAQFVQKIQENREDTIKEYAQARAAGRRALKKIAKYGSDIPMQRELNELLEKEELLKSAMDATKPIRNTAADFMARSTQEMANGNMAPEVEAVIRQVYQKYPGILEGLRLSLRTRKAGGRDAGNFNPYARIVTLWKDSSGVDNPGTIRHELTHSLEQMMTPEARKAVVEAWARSFENAIKRNPDEKSQAFFNKVFDFLDSPSKESFDAATKVMPSYDFYQYMNPSEYWAVNAEKLMAAKLGNPWARFVSAVKKLLEGLKSVFGVNNTFTVHKEFDNIINGKIERTKDKEMLIDYLLQGKVKIDFLNSIEDVNDLLDKHNRPEAPRKPSLSVRDAFMGGYDNTKETVKDVLTSPLIATNNMIGKADRALTYFRNKNIFFGYGLEEADRQRYGGQVRNAHQQAIASLAVVNALHSGNIATQVMTQGKLVFDKDIQMFIAEKSDKSMANVVREKAALIDKLGFETGNRVIQSYFEAKRSKSIVNEYLNREAAYEAAIESGQKEEEARRDLANIEKAVEKVNMDDEAIDDFIALENQYPELRKMMDNWTAVNQNMIDMMEFSGIISKQRAKSLRSIKDYVPWYRIMDDQEDIHSAPKNTRGLTNVAADKKFGPGKTERDIDDIVDNMIHNVLTITRNSARNYAANRVVMEYGDRYTEGKNAGKLRVFPSEGSDADGVRFNIIAAGRRIVVRIKDPLVAESVIGMENIDIPMNGALAFMANTLRRSITTFPAFQLAQLIMDAPTAALVTGLKRPDKVWAGVFTSFLLNLRKDDPIVAKLRAAGIGGYQSSARTPEKEIQLDIGLIQGSWFSKAMKGLDRFGDASDYAQRRSVYLQTMKETGDEMLALFQANNVIDFKKRGSGQIAQLVTKQVAFMNAYAQSIDVLAKGLAGTGLKGINRKKAIARMATAGMLLASATIVYCMLVGDDDEYNKLDDQTKMRTIFIPGLDVRLPMHSGAAFFFKAIPELIYNAIMKEGTKDEYDKKRLTRALVKAAVDSLLGPNPTPTGVKPVVEILLNRNFFTGGQVTPRGMEDLAAYRQYNQNTSELGKIISALTGTEKTRLLNPIEADHLVRGLTGTIGAAVMWGTNLLSSERPTPQAKDNPFYGQFIMPDVPRGREDLYYDLKSKTDQAYKTYMDLQKKQRKEEAAEWFKENKPLIQVYGYTSSIEADLKRLNGEIRRLSDLPSEKMSPDAKRKRMTELQELKGRILKDVISMRKRAGLDESYF